MSLSEVEDRPVLVAPTPPQKPLSFLAMMTASDDNMMAVIPAAAYEEPIYELKGGTGRFFIISDPAGIKRVLLDNVANYPKGAQVSEIMAAAFGDGLLTSDGDKWRSHRRTMAPSFDHRSIVAYAPAMVDASNRFVERWQGLNAGRVVDMQSEMTALTLAIITRTMFSADSDGIQTLMGDTLRDGIGAMTFSLLDMLPFIGPRRMARKMAHIHAIFSALDASIFELIDARSGDDDGGPIDLLGRLVAARDSESGAGLTNQEVRDEVVITFFAGHETTAIAMTFVWYLLAKHPKVEARLHKELDAVLGGRDPTHEDIENLPYTRQVIQEAMRLYPPAPGLSGRQAVADDEICGHHIPKGAEVSVMPWVLHRHKTLWTDPDHFDPDRFSPENSVGRDRFAYLPFGGGPRICIGMAMANAEAVLMLATLAQRFQPRLVGEQDIALSARITLRARDGIRMTVEPRRPNQG